MTNESLRIIIAIKSYRINIYKYTLPRKFNVLNILFFRLKNITFFDKKCKKSIFFSSSLKNDSYTKMNDVVKERYFC